MKARRRAIGIWLLGGFEVLLGVAGTFVGILGLVSSRRAYFRNGFWDITPVLWIGGLALLVIAPVVFATGILMIRLKPAGRMLNILFLAVLAVGSVVLLLYGEWTVGSIGLCLAGLILFYLSLPGVKQKFQKAEEQQTAEPPP